jgi:uncharacterized protein YprB with RNaseH-like and TPR domain
MDASSLAARVREALRQSGGPGRQPGPVARPGRVEDAGPGRVEEAGGGDDHRARADAQQAAWMADVLGGWWHRAEDGVCLIVDRDYRPDTVHGSRELGLHAEVLERYAASLVRFGCDSDSQAPLEFGNVPAARVQQPGEAGATPVAAAPADETAGNPGRLLFFDLETTGLSGGAGTCAFLIGCGWFEGFHFRTRQYLLTGYGYEAALLKRACASAAEAERLVTFNGKTFDVPLIESRYLFHRLASPFSDLPHVDLLHHARRLWRYRQPDGDRRLSTGGTGSVEAARYESYFRATSRREAFRKAAGTSGAPAGCTLSELETAILGFSRAGDVPGAEIPSRYFHYVRTGDVRPLEPVLVHNRFDLISLAALASVVARMIAEGPAAATNAHECLALGRMFEGSGRRDRAEACFRRVVEEAPGWTPGHLLKGEALRRLARACRRERRHDEAAEAWARVIALSDHAAAEYEALEALAVHHEHRSKDLAAARAYAVRALAASPDPAAQEAARYRLARIDRKLGRIDA